MPNLFFHKKDLEAQLDFFKKFRSQDNNVGRWLTTTTTIILITIISLYMLNTDIEKTYSQLLTEQQSISDDLVCAQENSKNFKNLKHQNLTLKKKQTKFGKNLEEKNYFLEALQETSKSIEDKTWVEKITFDPVFTSSYDGQAKHKIQNHKKIEIFGYSSDPQEVSSLHRKLTELNFMNNCKIDVFEKSKNNPELVQFKFSNQVA